MRRLTPRGSHWQLRPVRDRPARLGRVSVGWVTLVRSAAAPIRPVSATARNLTRYVRFSNMATFPDAGAAGRMSFPVMWGAGGGT